MSSFYCASHIILRLEILYGQLFCNLQIAGLTRWCIFSKTFVLLKNMTACLDQHLPQLPRSVPLIQILTMAPRSQDTTPVSPRNTRQPASGCPSWIQRAWHRVSTPVSWGGVWYHFTSRNTTESNLTTENSLIQLPYAQHRPPRQATVTSGPLASRTAHIDQALPTPIANYRPGTAPPSHQSITFRPIRWELYNGDAHRSTSSSVNEPIQACPYDPAVLHFFDDFEVPTSFCGLGSAWPWSAKRQVPIPCDDCLNGTDRAHISVSPSRIARKHQSTQQRRSSAINVKNGVIPDHPSQELSQNLRNSEPRRSNTSRHLRQNALQTPKWWDLPQRPPERMGHNTEPDTEATFNRLQQIVQAASSRQSQPQPPPPRLHQLSPNISFIHRHEVVAHQTAILQGRHSPVREHQSRGDNPIDVIGYTFDPSRRDSSSTVLYPETTIPGEYLPPSPPEVLPPTSVLSPLRRQSISLAPISGPVLLARLDQPPFVPALPEGAVLRPVREWLRSSSAPESWESVLRHGLVYRTSGADYRPRVPSPLHEQHNVDGLEVGDEKQSRSHGTISYEQSGLRRVKGRSRNSNEEFEGPGLRGGGLEEGWQRGPASSKSMLDQRWDKLDEYCSCDLDSVLRYGDYCASPEAYRLDTCIPSPTKMPRLRGGGKPDRRTNLIPASLLYLAGSTGRRPGESITVDAWNSMKPKKRMGGLLGMAVFGYKGGKSYVPEKRDQEVQTEAVPDLNISGTAEVEIDVA